MSTLEEHDAEQAAIMAAHEGRVTLSLNRLEFNAVLTGLRMLERHLGDGEPFFEFEILTDLGSQDYLSSDDVGDLADRVNETPAVSPAAEMAFIGPYDLAEVLTILDGHDDLGGDDKDAFARAFIAEYGAAAAELCHSGVWELLRVFQEKYDAPPASALATTSPEQAS